MFLFHDIQIQSIPTPWTWLEDKLRVPVVPEDGRDGIALRTGLLFDTVIVAPPVTETEEAQAVALVAGLLFDTVIVLAPIVENSVDAVALQTGLLFLVIVPGGTFSDYLGTQAVALVAGAVVVVVISGGTFSDAAPESIALIAGALV